MARRALDTRPTVRSEGGLLPPDLLDRVTDPRERDLPGLSPADYGLEANVRLTEAAARSWEHAKAYWGAFKARLESSRPGAELGVTRQQWLLPLLAELGYDDLDYRAQAEEINGRPFHISHRATSEAPAPPLHLVAASQPLDKTDASASGVKASPHGYLQSYLNETDHVWGIVSNGRQLRILRDNASLTRPAYLEFDLEGMMEGGVFSDFTLLWLVAHRTRLPKGTTDAASCLLEKWSEAAQVRGSRVQKELRGRVRLAINALGQGFLDHPENEQLRARLADGSLDAADYYRQILRMVYRMLFLLVAEERDLLFPEGAPARGKSIYAENYSLSRLRERIRLVRGDERHDDLWRSQNVAFGLLRAGNAGLGLPALGGGIFDPRMCPDLEGAQLHNDAVKEAVRGFSLAPTKSGYRRINYRDLDVEELGGIYEGLLDEQPAIGVEGNKPRFDLDKSGERKATGSYYTPPVLVQELIRSALDPVIQQALASAPDIEVKRKALLDLAVCDPACGSGHFLLAAARRIGSELARLASGEYEPDIKVRRHGTREAITHCVYGVDLNPLAVDLCRLALWLEGHEPGRPLGFLDHHIKCGNSLIGATAELIEKGIPTEAFEPVEGDSKDVAKLIKKQNRQELEKPQLRLFETSGLQPAGPSTAEANEARAIADFEEVAPEDVLLKEEEYEEFAAKLARKKRAADLWTAAYFWPLRDDAAAPPTQATLLHHRAGREQELGNAFERQLTTVLDEVRPFHWELEFPDVFDESKGGFDCMLGNPPWEKFEPKEQEFFEAFAPDVAQLAGDRRKRAIATLQQTDLALFERWRQYQNSIQHTVTFLKSSGRFPLGASGRINLYAVFAEALGTFVSRTGYSGILCPTGIATDDSTKALFGNFAAGRISSLFDFENAQGLFDGVHRSYKFCLLTVRGWMDHGLPADFAFFCTSIDHLREPDRHFTLTAEDFALFNPNTLTCPVFRSKRDAEIASKMYRRAGIFWKESRGLQPDANPWGVSFQQMFNMTSDSGLFRSREELESEGFVMEGNIFVRADGREYLPLYEAKLFHQYDHRFATFDGQGKEDLKAGNARDMTDAEKADPSAVVTPRYWVPAEEVGAKLDNGDDSITVSSKLEARSSKLEARSSKVWRLAFRQIVRATDERTGVWDVLPTLALGHSGAIVQIQPGESHSGRSPEPRTNEPC